MASITIRNLDDETKARLRLRAARQQRSMEEEARQILRTALTTPRKEHANLAQSIQRRFRHLGGLSLDVPPREPIRTPPRIGK
jgi:plasmid stability protein